ncbi:MAG TPA: hypothetical protein VFV93_09785 [Thermomicrobiales bacterium]|nr:hypothetical protein [Thermomicrobiales bacterium]
MHTTTLALRRPLILLVVVVTAMTTLLAANVSADQAEIGTPEEDCVAHVADDCRGQPGNGTLTVVEFDISEDMTRFSFDADTTHEDGLPARGSAFITQGYLYPAGTLNGSNGVLPDGSPEFPELVLGEWTCYGYYVGDGAHTTTGAMVITTQVFNIGDGIGGETIVTSGYEVADLNVAVARAITGGTGTYRNARGETSQQMLGLNATEGVVLRVTLNVQK